MTSQLQVWMASVPTWVPLTLALMALAATVQVHLRWRAQGMDPRRAKAVLVPACTVAVLGSLAPQVPYVTARLDTASLAQLTAFSLLASGVALVTAMVQARQLQAAGGKGEPWDGGTMQGSDWNRAWSSTDVPPQQPWDVGDGGPSPDSPQLGTYQPPAPAPAISASTVIQRPGSRNAQVAWLSATSGPHAGHSWTLGEETRIGRGVQDPCEVVLNDAAVSGGQHALIRLQPDGDYLLADLASSNGTFVNGEQVMRHTLRDKDRITIGTTELIFVQARLAPPAPAPASGEPT